MQVERGMSSLLTYESGARVRNAYAIYLFQGDSPKEIRINTA